MYIIKTESLVSMINEYHYYCLIKSITITIFMYVLKPIAKLTVRLLTLKVLEILLWFLVALNCILHLVKEDFDHFFMIIKRNFIFLHKNINIKLKTYTKGNTQISCKNKRTIIS